MGCCVSRLQNFEGEGHLEGQRLNTIDAWKKRRPRRKQVDSRSRKKCDDRSTLWRSFESDERWSTGRQTRHTTTSTVRFGQDVRVKEGSSTRSTVVHDSAELGSSRGSHNDEDERVPPLPTTTGSCRCSTGPLFCVLYS